MSERKRRHETESEKGKDDEAGKSIVLLALLISVQR